MVSGPHQKKKRKKEKIKKKKNEDKILYFQTSSQMIPVLLGDRSHFSSDAIHSTLSIPFHTHYLQMQFFFMTA